MIIFLEPGDDYGRVQAAAVGQHDFSDRGQLTVVHKKTPSGNEIKIHNTPGYFFAR
jgi:hypothetical protein